MVRTEVHECECARCLHKDKTEDDQPCWECYENALHGNATGRYFVPIQETVMYQPRS
jgi:hypothetical protein